MPRGGTECELSSPSDELWGTGDQTTANGDGRGMRVPQRTQESRGQESRGQVTLILGREQDPSLQKDPHRGAHQGKRHSLAPAWPPLPLQGGHHALSLLVACPLSSVCVARTTRHHRHPLNPNKRWQAMPIVPPLPLSLGIYWRHFPFQ